MKQGNDSPTDADGVRVEFATMVIEICLAYLVKVRFVEREIIAPDLYVRFLPPDHPAMQGIAAGASLDSAGRPFVAFSEALTFNGIQGVAPHEAIHIAQIMKGDLDPLRGESIWKGQAVQHVPHDDERYFEDQPWESEARHLEDDVRRHLNAAIDRNR